MHVSISTKAWVRRSDKNNVKMEEALSGRVARPSFLPDSVPGERK